MHYYCVHVDFLRQHIWMNGVSFCSHEKRIFFYNADDEDEVLETFYKDWGTQHGINEVELIK